MCVCLFVNITRFDLYSVIFFVVFTGEIGENPQGKSIFAFAFAFACASLADLQTKTC